MKWILENFQIVLFVVVAFLLWLKGVVEKMMERRQVREKIPDSEDRFDPEHYSEPEGGSRLPPPLPKVGRDTSVGGAPVRVRRKAAPREHRHRKPKAITKATTTGGAAATSAALAAKGMEKPAGTTSGGLRKRLRSSGEIRRGIVLREILGPPVSLR
jgi:hypothetical protein